MTLEDQLAEDAERLPYCASPHEVRIRSFEIRDDYNGLGRYFGQRAAAATRLYPSLAFQSAPSKSTSKPN